MIETEAGAVRAMDGAIDDDFRARRAADPRLPGVGADHRHRQGRAHRAEGLGDVRQHRHAQPLSLARPTRCTATSARSARATSILIFSASGESDEILRLLSIVKKLDHPVIAITASRNSGLGRHADVVLKMGKIEEACPLGLAPSASTTAMLALGDALALSVMKLRKFTADDFALFHPAGQLGRKLIRCARR